MPKYTPVDVQLLYRLWNTPTLTRCEIARQLGVPQSYVTYLAQRHKLPPRGRKFRPPEVDPTPDEIAERARECRERHMALRRSEPVGTTTSKVSKWRGGICEPQGGRHV
jgi:hypothetical protein